MRRLWWVAGIAVGARVAVIAATPGYRPIHDDASYARVARALMTLGRYPGHRLPAGGWPESADPPPGRARPPWGHGEVARAGPAGRAPGRGRRRRGGGRARRRPRAPALRRPGRARG